MAKVKLKTTQTKKSVKAFLHGVKEKKRRDDCYAVLKIMKSITKAQPRMWGPSIVGFGSYHYKYESGREGDMFLAGFSPRKQNLTLYIMSGFREYNDLLRKLGKHKTGSSCLYLNSLDDVDSAILKKLIGASVKKMKKRKT